ncbi:MAG: molybdopterin converting factor subunit 1 [Kordiimonadales bacterium]|nr:MAG: molybdopterin converting factor subunit 1 [Kordiimonadales bacterium]
MQLIYFASIREQIGLSEEEYDLPSGVHTVEALLDDLRARGPNYASALLADIKLKVAVNQQHAKLNTSVKDQDEVAIFPPVTGG